METTNFVRSREINATKRCVQILSITQKTIRSKIPIGIILFFIFSSLSSCRQESTCHDEMIFILEKYKDEPYSHRNQIYPKVRILHTNSQVLVTYRIRSETRLCKCLKAHLLMELGQKAEAIKMLEDLPEENREKQQIKS